ncbi:hypothetical protein [Actinomadura madurae]|uniref:hypothetical protein n=1 Tax=Actinomadura madurae TaxID=1993 RepID=UPI0020D1F64A|nr:hypothetical protein [Actinomadura madurae]MCP9949929.1 hypothetical protein [Actinomadura madurae]MCP9966687.1 hypothetical protein [Actinomadura madurae]MCP9979174.1 hypothetical protein [Actinomadura madurae]MCQ0009297.1 hypothetical protein [Actinomadura madurae]MCQ0015362.1 hypothetical protein [Actinomadura madurae]
MVGGGRVQQDDVGAQALGEVEGRGGVVGVGDDLEFVAGVQQGDHVGSDPGVPVHHEYAERGRLVDTHPSPLACR